MLFSSTVKPSVCLYSSNVISERKNNQFQSVNMKDYSDSESNTSFPELHSRGITDDIDNRNMANQEKEHDIIRTDQSFLESITQFAN